MGGGILGVVFRGEIERSGDSGAGLFDCFSVLEREAPFLAVLPDFPMNSVPRRELAGSDEPEAVFVAAVS